MDYILELVSLDTQQPSPKSLAVGERIRLSSRHLWLQKADKRGRSPKMPVDDLVYELDDPTVSWGRGFGHCCIWVEEKGVHVKDFGSDNGTWVIDSSGDKIMVPPFQPPILLPVGWSLRVGRHVFRLVKSEESTE